MMHRLIIIAQCAEEHFSGILRETPIIYSDKVRLFFVDGSYMDIRYPVDSKYSFHWQREDEMIRIDTAPHHPIFLLIQDIFILEKKIWSLRIR